MSLNVLDNKFRINLANNDFYNILTTYSAKSISGKVQYEIFKDNSYADFNFLQNIFYLKDLGIWFSYIKNIIDIFTYLAQISLKTLIINHSVSLISLILG